uniref:Uncharacterized protein n=1 Tax=Panagrolaimus davidi TaxID=227884 RepID=A0A914PMD7_9BILA
MEILESMKNAFKLAEQEEKERQGEKEGGENSVNLSENFGGYYGDEKLEGKMNANISLKTTFNNSVEQYHADPTSFSQNYSYENSKTEQTNLSTTDYAVTPTTSLTKNIGYESLDATNINSSFVPNPTDGTVKEKMTTIPLNNYEQTEIHSEINPTNNIPVTEQTPLFTITDSIINPSLPAVNTLNENIETENIIYIESPEDEQKCMGDPGEPGNDGYDGADGLPGLNGLPGDDGEKLIYGDICNC